MSDSISQTIALPVSLLVSAACGVFVATMLNAGSTIGADNYTQTEITIATAQWKSDIADAREVLEATAKHVTVRTGSGDCIAWAIDLDADFRSVLSRTSGACDDDLFATQRRVMLQNLTPDSAFVFTNIAGLPVIHGHPQGVCEPWFIPVECTSTIPAVIDLAAAVKMPVTGIKGVGTSVTTQATSLTMLVSGDTDVAYNKSVFVMDEAEGETP